MQTSLGIIEGFYGRLYEKEQREALCSFAADCGYSYYIFAPKNYPALRREWKRDFTDEECAALREFSGFCKSCSMTFGIGISPLGITEDPHNGLELLLKKINTALKEFDIGIVAILFDDIKLYTQDEGLKQKQIVQRVYEELSDRQVRVIFCPTYYSFDPILDKVFGKCPPDYFEQITQGLDKNIEVFWTGNKVLSKSITKDDIEKINAMFSRKVTLWDNYPVNDGKFISKKIYTREFTHRDNLDGVVLSHAVNPMLEGNLNKFAIKSLPMCYEGRSPDDIATSRLSLVRTLFKNPPERFVELLDRLNDEGIEGISEEERSYLKLECGKIRTAESDELTDFLNGVYKFDPQCLTS